VIVLDTSGVLAAVGEAQRLHGPARAVDPSLEPILRRAAPLTEYAWRFRYPGAPAAPTRREADGAVELAADVLGAIVARLPTEVEPPTRARDDPAYAPTRSATRNTRPSGVASTSTSSPSARRAPSGRGA
jgi:hypothetical protein